MQGENSLSVYISKVVQLRLKSGAVTSANRPISFKPKQPSCVFLKSLVSFCFVKLIFLSLFYLFY